MRVAKIKKLYFFFAEKNESDKRECEKIHKPWAWSLPLG
jgi:hypothetical protein